MFGLMKIAGLSAVLSAGLVTAFEVPSTPEHAAVMGHKFLDRLPQGDHVTAARITVETTGSVAAARETAGRTQAAAGKGDFQLAASAGCAGQAWPNIAPACLTAADGTPVRHAVRTITLEERRDDARTSVLVRLPAAEFAQR